MTPPPTRRPVLVVDDDADLRSLIVEILAQEGYAAAGAANGEEALAKLRAGMRPSVILLDMMMPVMDGWRFREQQRADAALADIPVVVVSAYTDVAATAAELGAAAGIAKPLSLEHMLEVIERVAPADDRPRRG